LDFHLYFHDDLDGIATGAVFLKFLRTRGDQFTSYTPLEYGPALDKIWREYAFKSPSVLVDFRYHPSADWWVDHHGTAFFYDEWKASYHDDAQHYYDPKGQSGCGTMIMFLKKQHGYDVPDYHHELARRVDAIDSASFESVEEAISTTLPHMQLSLIIEGFVQKDRASEYQAFRQAMIGALADTPLADIVREPQYREYLEKAAHNVSTEIEHIKADAQLRERAIYIDHSNRGMPYNRFIPFSLFPKQLYVMTVIKQEGVYKVTFSVNPWRKAESKLVLGEIAREYGGGGHPGIGALRVSSREEALKIAEEVLRRLNEF